MNCPFPVSFPDLIQGVKQPCLLAAMRVVPGEQSELADGRLEASSAQGKASDAQTALDGPFKQPGSYPIEDTVQVELTPGSRKSLPGFGLDAVRIGHGESQLSRTAILRAQASAQHLNQPVEVAQ